jgi:hypothetical protein
MHVVVTVGSLHPATELRWAFGDHLIYRQARQIYCPGPLTMLINQLVCVFHPITTSLPSLQKRRIYTVGFYEDLKV